MKARDLLFVAAAVAVAVLALAVVSPLSLLGVVASAYFRRVPGLERFGWFMLLLSALALATGVNLEVLRLLVW